jgi:SsrA-binding protein
MEKKNNILIDNRKANYNYFLLEEYVAGIVLIGCEIKSIRNRDVNMSDSYCTFVGNELIIKNMHISPYKNSGFAYGDYDPKRDRKLLLTKRELRKLQRDVQTKGITIVPVNLYTNDKGLVKLTIAVAKGKHTYDKSQSIKERDLDREMKNID